MRPHPAPEPAPAADPPTGPTRRERVAFAAALVLITAAGAWLRLADLDRYRINPDTVHPFVDALRFLDGQDRTARGRGSGFAYGWLLKCQWIPLVAVAGSLRQVLVVKGLVHALVPLFTGLAARQVAGPAAALAAAAWVAWNPILVVYPRFGAFTYEAPVWASLWVLLLARSLATGSPRTALGVPLAAMAAVLVHPYALVLGAATALAWPALARRCGGRAVALGAAAAAVAAWPMARENLRLLGQDGSIALEGAATHLPEDFPALQPLVDLPLALRESVGAASGPGAVLVLVLLAGAAAGAGLLWRGRGGPGEAAAATAARRLIVACLGANAAFVALALGLGYVTQTHGSILLPLDCVAAAGALAAAVPGAGGRWRALRGTVASVTAAAAVAIGAQARPRLHEPQPFLDHLAVWERAVELVLDDAGDHSLAPTLVTRSDRPGPFRGGSAPIGAVGALMLEARLRGAPAAAFPLEPDAGGRWPRPYVVVAVPDDTWSAWAADLGPGPRGALLGSFVLDGTHRVRVLRFLDLAEAASWLRAGCGLSRAHGDLWIDQYRHLYWSRKGGWPGHPFFESWAELCLLPGMSDPVGADLGSLARGGPSPVPRVAAAGSRTWMAGPRARREMAPGVDWEVPEGWTSRRAPATSAAARCSLWGQEGDLELPLGTAVVCQPDLPAAGPLRNLLWRTVLGDLRDPGRLKLEAASGAACGAVAGHEVCSVLLYDPAAQRAVVRRLFRHRDRTLQVDLLSPDRGASIAPALLEIADTLRVDGHAIPTGLVPPRAGPIL